MITQNVIGKESNVLTSSHQRMAMRCAMLRLQFRSCCSRFDRKIKTKTKKQHLTHNLIVDQHKSFKRPLFGALVLWKGCMSTTTNSGSPVPQNTNNSKEYWFPIDWCRMLCESIYSCGYFVYFQVDFFDHFNFTCVFVCVYVIRTFWIWSCYNIQILNCNL